MIVWTLPFIFLYYGQAEESLRTAYEWKYVEYEWECNDHMEEAINSGNYNSTASVLVDVEIAFDRRVFVTIRRTKGVPATSAVITELNGSGGPLVRPYPNWKINEINGCTGLINVLHIDVNARNQLWVLDSGMIDDKYKCPAKLVIIDLDSDEIVTIHEIPRKLYQGVLTTIVVYDDNDDCSSSSALLGDTYGGAVIIYTGGEFCRLELSELVSYPSTTIYGINGDSFRDQAGILRMTIVKHTDHNFHQATALLYLRPLGSHFLYSMLLNRVLSYCATSDKPHLFKHLYRIETRSSALVAADGIIFLGSIETTSLDCYNTATILSNATYVKLVKDNDRLQWISGMKGYPKSVGRSEELVILSNRYQKVVTHTISDDEINYRILIGSTDKLTFQTDCY